MARHLRPCIEPRCSQLTYGTRCAAHEAVRNSTRQAQPHRWVYRDPRWARTRRLVLARDGFACVDCGAFDPSGRKLHADHRPQLREILEAGLDPFDPENAETRCHSCHSRVESERRAARGPPAL